ncbi:Nn.00g021980.m01.CDS01 [Neocucurbitaria sp. VM-36]
MSGIVATVSPSPPQTALPSMVSLPSQPTETSQQTPIPVVPRPDSAPSIPKSLVFPTPGHKSENSLSFWESMNDALSCFGRLDPVIRSISLGHMQMLLETYQNMINFFPFVALPKDCFCRDLVQNRPVLMFAVLTVASYDSVLLQLTLSREFRKVIMAKILNGQKNLDLLQGLLVFIAWHHHYMDAQAVSVPMLLQICVGIASDLGLDRMSTTARSPLQKDDSRDREAKRAYLGCYYLASNIALMEHGRARPISYSSTLRSYASQLASSREHKSDAILPVLIDVCQFTEDVEETFRNEPEQALVARSQVNRLNDKWENIRHASTLQASDFGTLQWIQLAARVYLYRTTTTIELSDRESTPWASGFHLSLRVTCLRSIEQFLDNSTKLPSGQFELLSLIDWLNLVSITTSLSKLALNSSPVPGWDPTELQIAKSFDYFRDQLASRMPRPRDTQESNEDLFDRFRRITTVMKTALWNAPGRGSPIGSTFELATGSGRRVSLLQDLPLPRPNSMINGPEKLPSLWKVNPSFDMNSDEFHWRFLMGTV